MDGQGMPFIIHAQSTCTTTSWVNWNQKGTLEDKTRKHGTAGGATVLMSLLSHSQTVATTAGDSRCQESLTHWILRDQREKTLKLASFCFCY